MKVHAISVNNHPIMKSHFMLESFYELAIGGGNVFGQIEVAMVQQSSPQKITLAVPSSQLTYSHHKFFGFFTSSFHSVDWTALNRKELNVVFLVN